MSFSLSSSIFLYGDQLQPFTSVVLNWFLLLFNVVDWFFMDWLFLVITIVFFSQIYIAPTLLCCFHIIITSRSTFSIYHRSAECCSCHMQTVDADNQLNVFRTRESLFNIASVGFPLFQPYNRIPLVLWRQLLFIRLFGFLCRQWYRRCRTLHLWSNHWKHHLSSRCAFRQIAEIVGLRAVKYHLHIEAALV